MARKRFDVEVPDGQHLGFSRDTDGAYRAHLFDNGTNDLVGHAELFEPEHDTDSPDIQYVFVPDSGGTKDRELTDEELDEALEALVALGMIVAGLAAAAAPHVRRWWQDTAIPGLRSASDSALLTIKSSGDNALLAMKSAWNNLPVNRKFERGETPAEMVPATEPLLADPSTELEVAFHDYRARMGSAEARERFVLALVARAFSEEQMRMLRNAQIVDDGDSLSLEAATERLTPKQVGETITLMLEKNPTLLDRGPLAELGTILGSRGTGKRVPLRVDRMTEVPRPIRGHVRS